MKTYYLDHDYRKDPPEGKPHCIRCQKAIKDPAKAVKVHMVDDWNVAEGGDLLIGKDCWKKILKESK